MRPHQGVCRHQRRLSELMALVSRHPASVLAIVRRYE
ncbi:MAG: GNAT family N-acetyltransferase, partial [Mesorhizobium sp.]